MEEENSIIFHSFRDGEKVEYWDPVVSTVQGSLACERQKSTGRLGKDRKEFKLTNSLNSKFHLSLYEVLGNHEPNKKLPCDKNAKGVTALMNRLSHLGARYPSVSGLGIYVSGLKNFEGKGFWKKVFDFLFWISSQEELDSYWKYIILTPIGKMILNQNTEGKFKQKSQTLLLMLGYNALAYEVGKDYLQNKSAQRDSLRRGEKLAKSLHILFYSNTRPYNPKVRRRGYSRSTPVRPGSSKTAISQANTSLEFLTESGYLKKSEEGGYEMEEKINVEEILFQTFKNSLKAFEIYQEEKLKQKAMEKPEEQSHPPEEGKEEKSSNQGTSQP